MFLWVRERADLYLYLTRSFVGACGGLNNPLDCLDSAWGDIHIYDRAYLLHSQQLNIVDDYFLQEIMHLKRLHSHLSPIVIIVKDVKPISH